MTLKGIDELDSFLAELKDDDQAERQRFLEQQEERFAVIKTAVDLSKEIHREREAFLAADKQKMTRLKEAISTAKRLGASDQHLAKVEVPELKVAPHRTPRKAKPRRRTAPSRPADVDAQVNSEPTPPAGEVIQISQAVI